MQIIGNLKNKQITFYLNISLSAGAIKVFCISACIYDLYQLLLAGKGPQPRYWSRQAIVARGFCWAGCRGDPPFAEPRGIEGAFCCPDQ